MQKQIFTQGFSGDIVLTANQSLTVWSPGECNVYQKVGYPNQPNSIVLLAQLNGQNLVAGSSPVAQQTFGPYASGGVFQIENTGGNIVYYTYGGAPIMPSMLDTIQISPASLNTTGNITGSHLSAGIVTSTTAAAVAGTLPTGTSMDTQSLYNTNDCFDWYVINTGANAFTVTAAASHTIVGAAAVAAGTSGHFRTRKTAAATFVTYRVS